jgi:hypothetical protein
MKNRQHAQFNAPMRGWHALSTLVWVLAWSPLVATSALENAPAGKVGAAETAGCGPSPIRVKRLIIDKPGVYENYLVDGEWDDSTLVKINADGVVLRHCEIRRGRHNAVTVYAKDVVIDSCKIHHVLKSSFDDQHDAHGITGRPTNLIIRNCDIGLVSGDCIQFDPGRGAWDEVLVERCTLWTGPLPEDAAGFKKGERPGENAIDTKQQTTNPRSRLTIRSCLMSGWNQPGQITNMAALNLKDHVQVSVEDSVFYDNEISFRVRGGTGERGGAVVSIARCAVYDSAVAVRAERRVRLEMQRLGIGSGVKRKLLAAGGGDESDYKIQGEFVPPPIATVLREGP